MLYLIEDGTTEPGQFGALPALLARILDADLMHAATHFDEARFPDAYQHVTAPGRLVASGLVWRTRTGEHDADELRDTDDLSAALQARTRDVVLVVQSRETFDALRARSDLRLRALHVERDGDTARVVEKTAGRTALVMAAQRDRFGRWFDANGTPRIERQRRSTIAFIGRASDQREQYPATLAALGDAADVLGVELALRFVAPQDIDGSNAASLLGGVDGILLPGGADMSRVAGQIEAARFGWQASIPVVGLCLGMQSMATAIARLALQAEDIGLMEAQPDARIASFIPIGEAADGTLLHRLGEQPVTAVQGSRIARLVGTHARIHCNHRYRLNPALEAPLATLGVTVSARDESGVIADAIEAAAHPFFAGMQGHPELASRFDHPHPLLTGFLEAAGTPAQAAG